jgi:hypothetical protein
VLRDALREVLRARLRPLLLARRALARDPRRELLDRERVREVLLRPVDLLALRRVPRASCCSLSLLISRLVSSAMNNLLVPNLRWNRLSESCAIQQLSIQHATRSVHLAMQ